MSASTTPDGRSPKTLLQAVEGKHLMFWLFIACYSAVHLKFEYNFWLTDAHDIFGKYAVSASPDEALAVAKEVYFTKATWMIALVWMMAAGVGFRAAIAGSFALYSLELVYFFPLRTYTFLNLLLAFGMVAEQVVEWRQAREGS